MYLSTSRQLLAFALIAASLVVAPSGAHGAKGRVGEPEVTCAACIVVADTGEVLWARAARVERANASTTKMVTALLVDRAADRSETVQVSATAAGTGGGGLDLQPGDRYSVGDLLYALLLSSSNDSAVALAEHIAGSEAAFVEGMNAYVDDLGLEDTRFVTSHGLDAPGHYSSARDLATIATEVLADPELAEIVATPEIDIAGPDGLVPVENRNLLLESYRGAIGVKTGFTANAGNVLVAAAQRSGRRVIVVAMGSADAALDAARLLDNGFDRLARGVLIKNDLVVGSLLLDPAGAVTVVAGGTLRGITDPRTVSVEYRPDVEPSVESGAGGEVIAFSKGRVIGSVPAVVDGPDLEVEQPSLLGRFFAGVLSLGNSAADALGVR